MSRPDISLMALQDKYAIPEGWQVFIWERVNMDTPNEAIQYTGAVCDAVFLSGPRKGHKNWSKRDKATEMRLTMTLDEMKAFRDRWSIETGNCNRCLGTGTVWMGWSASEGEKTRECPDCKGTGKRADIASVDAVQRRGK